MIDYGKDRANILSLVPKGGKVAEIGVMLGGFSGRILELTECQELILIDHWPKGVIIGAYGIKIDGYEAYLKVKEKFKNDSRVILERGNSLDKINKYPDEYFDFIYVDGDHRYQGVLADLNACYYKVKTGGILAGDDYNKLGWIGKERTGYNLNRRGVIPAVEDFLKEHHNMTLLGVSSGKTPSFVLEKR